MTQDPRASIREIERHLTFLRETANRHPGTVNAPKFEKLAKQDYKSRRRTERHCLTWFNAWCSPCRSLNSQAQRLSGSSPLIVTPITVPESTRSPPCGV